MVIFLLKWRKYHKNSTIPIRTPAPDRIPTGGQFVTRDWRPFTWASLGVTSVRMKRFARSRDDTNVWRRVWGAMSLQLSGRWLGWNPAPGSERRGGAVFWIDRRPQPPRWEELPTYLIRSWPSAVSESVGPDNLLLARKYSTPVKTRPSGSEAEWAQASGINSHGKVRGRVTRFQPDRVTFVNTHGSQKVQHIPDRVVARTDSITVPCVNQ